MLDLAFCFCVLRSTFVFCNPVLVCLVCIIITLSLLASGYSGFHSPWNDMFPQCFSFSSLPNVHHMLRLCSTFSIIWSTGCARNTNTFYHVVSMSSPPSAVISSFTTRLLISSLFHAVVPRLKTYLFSFSGLSLGISTLRSISVEVAVMMQASTLEPDPRSLNMPAKIASLTRFRASSLCGRS